MTEGVAVTASNALIECPGLRPIRLLREDEVVKVHYLDTGAEFRLDADRPVEALHTVTANDDETVLEVCDSHMLAVRQLDAAGEPQTVMLSPRMALELSRVIDSFVFFPLGINAE